MMKLAAMVVNPPLLAEQGSEEGGDGGGGGKRARRTMMPPPSSVARRIDDFSTMEVLQELLRRERSAEAIFCSSIVSMIAFHCDPDIMYMSMSL